MTGHSILLQSLKCKICPSVLARAFCSQSPLVYAKCSFVRLCRAVLFAVSFIELARISLQFRNNGELVAQWLNDFAKILITLNELILKVYKTHVRYI